MDHVIYSWTKPSTITILILHMENLRHREVRLLSQGRTENEREKLGFESLDLVPQLFTTVPDYLRHGSCLIFFVRN